MLFRETFEGDSREVQRSLKEVQRVCYGSFKVDPKIGVLKESVKCVSRKYYKSFAILL